MELLYIFSFALLGAIISRWHGGGFVGGSPKLLKNVIWAVPFGAFAAVVFDSKNRIITDWLQETFERLSYIDFEIIDTVVLASAVALCFILCVLGKTTGHGGGMDLAHSDKEPGGNPSRSPEKLEHLILWLHGKIPQYWYDFLLLAIVGMAATSGGIFAAAFFGAVPAIVVATGGAMKAVAYAVGWKWFNPKRGPYDQIDEATEVGEFLTGFFAYAALAAAVAIM